MTEADRRFIINTGVAVYLIIVFWVVVLSPVFLGGIPNVH